MPHSGLPKPPGPFKKLLQLILDVVSAFNPPIDAARKIWKWLKAEGAAMKRGWHLFTVLAILFAALSFWLGLLYCEYSQRSQKTIAGGTRGDLFPRVDLSPASSQNCDDKYRGDLEHEFSPITLGKLCVDAFDLQCWNSVKTLFERAKQQEPNANEADGWKEVYPLYAGALLRRDKPNDAYAALQQMTNEIGKDVELYNNHFNNPAVGIAIPEYGAQENCKSGRTEFYYHQFFPDS